MTVFTIGSSSSCNNSIKTIFTDDGLQNQHGLSVKTIQCFLKDDCIWVLFLVVRDVYVTTIIILPGEVNFFLGDLLGLHRRLQY